MENDNIRDGWTPMENDNPRAVAYHTYIINHAQNLLKIFPGHNEREMLEKRIAQFKALLPPKDHPVWEGDHKMYFRKID